MIILCSDKGTGKAVLGTPVSEKSLSPTLCDPVDYTVNGMLQARILDWATVLFSRASFQPRDRTQVSHIAGRFFTR